MAPHLCRLFLALAVSTCLPPTGSAAPDVHGDPLPEGAVARLGTTRLRAVCEFIHFSADGKTLVGVDNGYFIRVWNAADGKLTETRRLKGRPTAAPWSVRSVRSDDGKTLLIADASSLEMWDLPSGKRLDVPLPKDRKQIDRFAVSDDRRLVLFGEVSGRREVRNEGSFGRLVSALNLVLWDTTTGKQRVLDDSDHSLVALTISPDGKWLASSSYGKGTRVWDTAAGKVVWSETRYNAEKVAFTPDGKHLISAPGGGQGTWHVRDVETGKAAKGLQPPHVGYAWTFTLSPDGGRVVVPTETDYVLWDLKQGKELHSWPGAKQWGKAVFAPDGKSVVTYDTILRRWDVATGKPLYDDVALLGHTGAVTRVFFTPDGKTLATVGEDRVIRLWDVAKAKLARALSFETAKPILWAMTPDGTSLVGIDERLTVNQWTFADTANPPERYELTAARKLGIGLRPVDVRVMSDGKSLALAGWPINPEYQYRKYSFSFWALETGDLRRWGGDPGNEYDGHYCTLSPDGRLALGVGKIHDTRTGKRRVLPAEDWQMRFLGQPRLAPDGRLLAWQTETGVQVWEVATGRTLANLPREKSVPAAISADGRRFAFADHERLVVRDLATGSTVVERMAPEEMVTRSRWITGEVAFSPDGRTVATAHPDGTVLLWAVPAVPKPEAGLSERDEAKLWEDLQGDPAQGYAAVWRLGQHPEAAVRLLEKRFAPPALPAVDEWRALLGDLDGGFRKREAATKRLEGLGKAAEGPLRQALKEKPTLEQRKRIEDLLAALEPSDPPRGQQLRAVRAVAVLESLATPEARKVLKEWSERGADARLADEASRALQRLKWRPQ